LTGADVLSKPSEFFCWLARVLQAALDFVYRLIASSRIPPPCPEFWTAVKGYSKAFLRDD
jgi:hypothetical protein